MSSFGTAGMSNHLLGGISLGTAIGGPPPVPTPVGCFVTGTMILTAEGEKAVESLSEGDVLVTASGERTPMVWLGRRKIDTTKAANRLQLLPVRIKAGAFAEGVPHRDLFVSADHAMLLDGVFVPAFKLINGETIAQVEVAEVTYFHVECERHTVLLANGAPAESYMDVNNRSFFTNAPGVVDLKPKLTNADFRAMLAAPWGRTEQVAAIRKTIFRRCEALGRPIRTDDTAEDRTHQPQRVA